MGEGGGRTERRRISAEEHARDERNDLDAITHRSISLCGDNTFPWPLWVLEPREVVEGIVPTEPSLSIQYADID